MLVIPLHERRAGARQRSYIEARAIYCNTERSRDLIVRNLSDDGAMIESEHIEELPYAFTLALPRRGAVYSAQMRWHKGKRAGVSLVPIAKAAVV